MILETKEGERSDTSPTSLLSEYADSGRRGEFSSTGMWSGTQGAKGRPSSVSEEARTRFLMPSLREASRMLYVLRSSHMRAGYNVVA